MIFTRQFILQTLQKSKSTPAPLRTHKYTLKHAIPTIPLHQKAKISITIVLQWLMNEQTNNHKKPALRGDILDILFSNKNKDISLRKKKIITRVKQIIHRFIHPYIHPTHLPINFILLLLLDGCCYCDFNNLISKVTGS